MAQADFFIQGQVFNNPNPCSYYPYPKANNVKDYMILENNIDPSSISLRRNINVRRVRLDNGTPQTLKIGIYPFRYIGQGCNSTENDLQNVQPQFEILPGCTRYLGLNPPGNNLQFFWVFNQNNELINDPYPVEYHHNIFVIRSSSANNGQLLNRDVNGNIMRWGNKDVAYYSQPEWVWFNSYRTTV